MKHTILCLALLALSGCAGSLSAQQAQLRERGLSATQLMEVAQELERRGDTARAQQYWMEALEQGAPAERVFPRLLSAYVRDRQYRLAAQRAEDHLRRYPNSLQVRVLLAALYQAMDDYPKAIAQYGIVVSEDPARADAHYALATALQAQGHDHARADLHYRKYLELDPSGQYAERAQAALLQEVEAVDEVAP